MKTTNTGGSSPAERVAALRRSDDVRRTHHVMLVRTFLHHGADSIAAAAHLGMHPNTFRFRLEAAAASIDLVLSDSLALRELQAELAR